jgi:hypothetical protein
VTWERRKMFDVFLEKRARKEIAVVRDCRDKYLELTTHYGDEAKRQRDELSYLETKMRSLHDTGQLKEAVELARRHKALAKSLKYSDNMCALMRDQSQLLANLMDALENLYIAEAYFVIIRLIPERQLPRLLKNPNNVHKVHDVCYKLNEHLWDYINRFGVENQQGEEAIANVDKVAQTLQEKMGITVEAKDADDLKYLSDVLGNLNSEVYEDKSIGAARVTANRV